MEVLQVLGFNNNSDYITGYAGVTEPTCGYTGNNSACNIYESTPIGKDGTNTINYKNTNSQVASTTGNYTGIYDMSGGAWEYVMGVRKDITSGSGGFSSTDAPEVKYYDVYKDNIGYNIFQYRILGDGTAEFGPFGNSNSRQISSWYSDEGWFIHPANPWFVRGGFYGYGCGAGVFAFDYHAGSMVMYHSFRIALSIK